MKFQIGQTNQTKVPFFAITHSLRLESQVIDNNRIKVRLSKNMLTLHQLLLHSLNFLCEKLFFFSPYYVENSAHFWPFFSVDATIISIANRQSNNASQQLHRLQTLVMSQKILLYQKNLGPRHSPSSLVHSNLQRCYNAPPHPL